MNTLDWLHVMHKHFSWVSVLLVLVASIVGLASIFSFLNYFDRIDLFYRSLEFGPSLFVLTFFYLVLLVFLIGSMLISSLVLEFMVSWLDPALSASAFRFLLLIVVLGMFGVVLALVFLPGIKWWPLLGLVVTPIMAGWFVHKHGGFLKGGGGSISLYRKFRLWIGVTVLSALSVVTGGIFSIYYVVVLFDGGDGHSEWVQIIFLLALCSLVMVASLAPAVGYRLGKPGIGFLSGIFLFLLSVLVVVPSIFQMASVGALRWFGISDQVVRAYLVPSEAYPSGIFDSNRWSVRKYGEGAYTVNGFSLYAYGQVNLICPSDLLGFKRSKWKEHAKECIPFSRGDIRVLQAVETHSESSGRIDESNSGGDIDVAIDVN